MFLRSLATAACCTLLATASLAHAKTDGGMKMDSPPAKLLPAPRYRERHPQRQSRHHQLQLSPPQRPHHRLRHRPLRRSLAHRSQSRHHPHHRHQPQDRHARRPRRHLHPLHPAQQRPVALHRQQEDRRVGHPLSRRQRPRPHTYDQQARRLLAGKHVHLLRKHKRKQHRTPRQMGHNRPVRNRQSPVAVP